MSKILKLGFLILYISLNFIIPNNIVQKYFPDKIYFYFFMFSSLFLMVLKLKNIHNKRIKISFIIILSLITLIPIFKRKKEFNINEYTDIYRIGGFFIFYYLFFNPSIVKSQNEFELSDYIYNLFDFVFKSCLIHLMYKLFMLNSHFKMNIKKFPYFKLNMLVGEVFEHYCILFSWYYLTEYLATKNKLLKNIIFNAFKTFILCFICKIIYLAVINIELSNKISDLINNNIPIPHNIILQNMFEISNEKKFNIFAGIILLFFETNYIYYKENNLIF